MRGSQTDRVSVCIVIVERLADGILGVKHSVAAFVIQFLKRYYNYAATCCCRPLSFGRWNTLVVRDCSEQRTWQLRVSASIEF